MTRLDLLLRKITDPFRRALARLFLVIDRSQPIAYRGMPALMARVKARIALRNEGRRRRREIKRFERRVRKPGVETAA